MSDSGFLFGPFRLDTEAELLLRGEAVVPLTPKSIEILLLLVKNAGRVVEKEELMKTVWPDTFVEESNLTQNISILRRALGESPGEKPYIETLPKRGYRFAASVSQVPTFEVDSRFGQKPTSFARNPRLIVILGLIFTGAIGTVVAPMIVGGGETLWFLREPKRSPATVPTTIPVTSYRGVEQQSSFSADGTQLAFAWNGESEDNFDIYVTAVGTGKALRLTSNPAKDFRPVWSPDGRFIAFLRDVGAGRLALLVTPSIGGWERRVAEVGSSPFTEFEPYLEWTSDNKWLATRDHSSPSERLGLCLISVETGEKRKLTSPPPGTVGDTYAAFSPDGRTLAFIRQRYASELCFVELSKGFNPEGDPKCFTLGDHWLSTLNWTHDGREIIFAAPSGMRGRPSLWRTTVDRHGGHPGVPQRISTVGESVGDPALSRDGRRLAYSSFIHNSNIWRTELAIAPNRIERTGKPTKITSSTRLDVNPQYSPNGKQIAFTSTRSGRPAIWVCSSDGSDAVQLTALNGTMTGSPRWSPDGQQLVFDSNVEGQFEIYVVHRDGGRLRRLTHHPAQDNIASWSRDGRWIYFASTRSGEQIWKMPAEGGEAVQLTHQGGSVAFESPDGKFVYYAKSIGITSLWRVASGGGDEVKVVDSVMGFSFTVADRGIYFISQSERGPAVNFYDFATGKVSLVTPIDGPLSNGLSVSPDGRFLSYSRLELLGSDLMLLDDFR